MASFGSNGGTTLTLRGTEAPTATAIAKAGWIVVPLTETRAGGANERRKLKLARLSGLAFEPVVLENDDIVRVAWQMATATASEASSEAITSFSPSKDFTII